MDNSLKHYRIEAGYTQRELADLLRCDHTYLSKVENHPFSSTPSEAFLTQFASETGADVEALCQQFGVFGIQNLRDRAKHNPDLALFLRRVSDGSMTDVEISKVLGGSATTNANGGT